MAVAGATVGGGMTVIVTITIAGGARMNGVVNRRGSGNIADAPGNGIVMISADRRRQAGITGAAIAIVMAGVTIGITTAAVRLTGIVVVN
jgi:hypothetical protein